MFDVGVNTMRQIRVSEFCQNANQIYAQNEHQYNTI